MSIRHHGGIIIINLKEIRDYLDLPSFEHFFNTPQLREKCYNIYGLYPDALDHLIPWYQSHSYVGSLDAHLQFLEDLYIENKIKRLALGEHVEYFEKDGLLL